MSIVICEHNVKDDNLNPRTLYPLKGGCQILFGLFVLPKSGRIGGGALLQKIHHIDPQKVSSVWDKNGAFKAAEWGVSPLRN